ncbi:hypothetical protein HG536_0B01560 [Torulaspora globosa]|uniref:Ribokinase n=1 Tax=Torulaspora globosa TaxID=48254 RepID=A0A7G3ZCQ7_9SACH|nr:uncharacterized protein HG536_0B01560 [Torulaspora globosa]QLL31293.1 hypothetical protein HG536_0B01560 [Torulaspora globosa]
MSITVVGSLNYDLVTYTDRLPEAGETFRANSFETHAGGKGLNQAIAIARLRHPGSKSLLRMVGNVGEDMFGQELLDLLTENGVDCKEVKKVGGMSTGVATILVEEKNGGQNRILLSEGANGKTVYGPDELSRIFNGKSSGGEKHYVVFQHEIPDPSSIMSWLKLNRPEFQIVFNPSPFKHLELEAWKNVDVLIVNEIEALQIVEAVYPEEECESYRSMIGNDFLGGYQKLCLEFQRRVVSQTNSATVVITLGSQGSLFCSKDHPQVGYTPSLTGINVVDTTGAGDTFLGSLVSQLHSGARLEDAIRFSTKSSSLTIQKKGAAETIPTFSEVMSLE